jgi:transcriptional regulator with XRE-family HTH domain
MSETNAQNAVVKRLSGTLRDVRQHRQLSLRDVEERSRIFAAKRKDASFHISASWLNRLEREEHGLTAKTLLVLSHIYGIEPDQLIRSIQPPSSDGIMPGETTLLPSEEEVTSEFYRWGIIGLRDQTLTPMIPPGSMVKIDIRRRTVEPLKQWANEFQRPIYFLYYDSVHFCGWCESDRTGRSLTLVPHPLSPASRRVWTDQDQVRVIGRVVAVIIQFDSS